MRVTLLSFIAVCFCLSGAIFAQSFPGQGGYPAGYGQPAGNGPAMISNPYGGGFTPEGQQPFMIPNGPHAGASPMGQYRPRVMNAAALGPQGGRGPVQPMFYGQDAGSGDRGFSAEGTGYMNPSQLFDDDGEEASPLLTRLRPGTLPGTFVRLEYLFWDLSGPGNVFLGSRQVGNIDPSVPFRTVAGTTSVTTLDSISVRDTSGIRGTLGLPIGQYGTLEFSSFLMEQARDKVVADGVSPLVATTVHLNGKQSNLARLFDSSFRAVYTTEFWGGGAQFVKWVPPEGEGFKLAPIVGFDYLNSNENLRQEGVFNANRTIPNVNSKVESDTNNNLFGPTFGFRAELKHRWFTLGVEPKLMMAANKYRIRVISRNFVGANDINLQTDINSTRFSPVADLGAYFRIHPREHITLSIGYQLYWLARVARPHEVINYDVNAVGGVPTTTNITAFKNFSDQTIGGLTAGIDWHY